MTYIHLSLTHPLTDTLTHWPVHNIPDALNWKVSETTSFPGSLILPPHRASEERPWHTLVTCFLTIKNITEGSSVIRQLVALGFVDRIQLSRCAAAPHPRWLLILSLQAENANIIYSNVYLKVKQVCLEAIYRDHLRLLPSYLLYLWKVRHISTVEGEQGNFIPH